MLHGKGLVLTSRPTSISFSSEIFSKNLKILLQSCFNFSFNLFSTTKIVDIQLTGVAPLYVYGNGLVLLSPPWLYPLCNKTQTQTHNTKCVKPFTFLVFSFNMEWYHSSLVRSPPHRLLYPKKIKTQTQAKNCWKNTNSFLTKKLYSPPATDCSMQQQQTQTARWKKNCSNQRHCQRHNRPMILSPYIRLIS